MEKIGIIEQNEINADRAIEMNWIDSEDTIADCKNESNYFVACHELNHIIKMNHCSDWKCMRESLLFSEMCSDKSSS